MRSPGSIPARALVLLLGCALWGAPARRAEAGPQVDRIRSILAAATDPKIRLAQVAKLEKLDGAGSAVLLAWLVETDATLAVRRAAATALGRITAPNAAQLIVDSVRRGGPRGLRLDLALALGRNADGVGVALRALQSIHAGAADKALLLGALAELDDRPSHLAIVARVGDDVPAVRDAALRALVRRNEEPEQMIALLGRRLAAARAEEPILELLDVIEPILHPTMAPALKRLAKHERQAIRSAAALLLERLAAIEAAKASPAPDAAVEEKDPEGRYAVKSRERRPRPKRELDPPEEALRDRVDRVFAIDATASTTSRLAATRARLLAEVDRRLGSGVNLRVGIVVYRGGHGPRERARNLSTLPLTFDRSRIRAFLESIDARGTDDRGAAVATALHEGLDRMSWRWNARRSMHVVADSKVDDVRRARRIVDTHFQADRTRTSFTYVRRTRTVVPEEYYDLALLGGTRTPELLR